MKFTSVKLRVCVCERVSASLAAQAETPGELIRILACVQDLLAGVMSQRSLQSVGGLPASVKSR